MVTQRQLVIIDLLWNNMKRVPGHKDRRQTSWGSKTQIGLVACIERIMDPTFTPPPTDDNLKIGEIG